MVSFRLAILPTTYTHFSFPHSVYMPRPASPPRLDYSNYWLSEFGRKKKTRRHFPPPATKIRNETIGKGSNALQQQKCKCSGQRSAIPHVTQPSSARWRNHPLFVETRMAPALGRRIVRIIPLGSAAIFRLTSVATEHSIVCHLPPPKQKSKFDTNSQTTCEQILCPPPGSLECPSRRKNNFHRK
jgi:hypothetical protein